MRLKFVQGKINPSKVEAGTHVYRSLDKIFGFSGHSFRVRVFPELRRRALAAIISCRWRSVYSPSFCGGLWQSLVIFLRFRGALVASIAISLRPSLSMSALFVCYLGGTGKCTSASFSDMAFAAPPTFHQRSGGQRIPLSCLLREGLWLAV